MERYINIVDHHQRVNNNHTISDKQVTGLPRCDYPWTSLVINQFGLTYNCLSPAWLPKSIGSLLDYNNLFDLLNTYEARSIRSEIDLGRYSFCNNKICHYLRPTHYQTNGQPVVLANEEEFTNTSLVKDLPNEICFDFDYTCNFKCPSCRTDMINHNQGSMYEVNKQLVHKIKHVIIDQYTSQPLTIRWAGGEPFVSKAYLDVWKYIVKQKNLNIRNVIQTNGSYLIKRGKLLEEFLPYIDAIKVSFDAGTSSTYKKIRLNGTWASLLKNCEYLHNLRNKIQANVILQSNFVTQLDNFKEIPKYIETAKQLGFDYIQINKMWNWGTWSTEEFDRLNVSNPDHPKYNELIEIIDQYINDPKVNIDDVR